MRVSDGHPVTLPTSRSARPGEALASGGASTHAHGPVAYWVVGVALTGLAVILSGIDWRSDAEIHTILETAATLLALTTGVLALVRYHGRRTGTALFLGIGFLGAAFLDGYHALVTTTAFSLRFPTPAASLIPWSWFASRLFLSVFLVAGWYGFRRLGAEVTSRKLERRTYLGGAAFTISSFAFFALVPLPDAHLDFLVHRPQELLPGALFAGALAICLREGRWRDQPLDHWLVFSLLVAAAGQVGFMAFSSAPFDPFFDAAHVLKVTSYGMIFAGLAFDTVGVFEQERRHSVELERSRQALRSYGERLEELVKERTRELEESEVRFRRVVESDMIGIIFWDFEGRITDANDAFLDIVGYTRLDLESGRINWQRMTPPEHREADETSLRELAQHGVCRPFEKEYVRKDRSRVPIQLGAATFPDGTGGVAYVLDISERRAAQEGLARLNRQLEARVRQRTADLEQANEELEAFAYTVSHDLRAPLRQVDGFSRILVEEHGEELSEDAAHLLSMTRRSAVRMGRLVDELLEFSRLGRRDLETVDIDPAEIARRALVDLDVPESATVDVAAMPSCRADPSLLRLVYLNLLENALKFSEERERPRVEVGAECVGGEPVYFVRDNGVGFDMRYADKLFGVFQRLHRSDEYPGTGVGLASVQRIIRRHGGRVWAQSEPDAGASFFFTLPEDTP